VGVDGESHKPAPERDFVFLPAPETYTLLSGPKERVRSALDFVKQEAFHRSRLIEYGGGGVTTSVIAGCFTFASASLRRRASNRTPGKRLTEPPTFSAALGRDGENGHATRTK
jgi:hypothetical protein